MVGVSWVSRVIKVNALNKLSCPQVALLIPEKKQLLYVWYIRSTGVNSGMNFGYADDGYIS